LSGGQAPNLPATPWLSHGGGVFVRDFGNLVLVNSAVVDNETTHSAALGGGIYFTQQGAGSISNSVITNNHSASYTGGVYLGGGSAPFGQVTVAGSIIAKNTAALPAPPSPQWGYDVGAEAAGRVFTSGGNNLIGPSNPTTAVGFTGAGDYSGAVDYVVTSVVDSFDNADNARALSVREAVGMANAAQGAQTLWLPAWSFVLTRQRTTTLAQGDVDVSHGDLDITGSLAIRGSGVAGATSVKWRHGAAADAVFDLIGDFNGNGVAADDGWVEGTDFMIWQQTLGSMSDLRADADDNGIIQGADEVL
jgi:hypothetical protein